MEMEPIQQTNGNGYGPSLRRVATEFFVATQAEDIEYILPIEQRMPRSKSLCKYLLCCILVIILSLIALYYGYSYDKERELKVYNNTVYAFLFLILCNLFIVLDYTEKFASFQKTFEIYAIYFLSIFLLLAFTDYVLIGLQEDALINGLFILIIIEILYYISLILFFCTLMSYWKSFSFHCSSKTWIHSLLYLSIIGGIFIFICRWLHPPTSVNNKVNKYNEENTYWHKKHNINAILSSIVSIVTLLFLFCVILGGIGICLFSSFANYTSQFHISIAFLSFIVISFVIMLTPLAPGSIVDACGGFIFILLLVPNGYFSFFISWCIAVISVVILHYCGACIQWWMGTWPCIQIWANINLPIEMLSASDAVLRNANWFQVGLIGYIFLDTANGLNQGRINMQFATQLFSEWTAIPNALGLVSFGATIAVSAVGLAGYDWTLDAVPLLIIFSTVVQAIGVTFATKSMAQCVDKTEYWTSREKWQIMHYFKKNFGYIPSTQGWINDVFNLANNEKNICAEFNHVLYDKVYVIHDKYIEKRNGLKDAQKRLNLYKKYLNDLCQIRHTHYERFRQYLPNAMEKHWLIHEPVVIQKQAYFEEIHTKCKQYLYYLLVLLLISTFWATFYGFYWTANLAQTVTNGIDNLRFIQWYWYGCLAVFMLVLIFIYHVEIMTKSASFCSGLSFIFTGCKINPDIETKFQTPQWIVRKNTNDENKKNNANNKCDESIELTNNNNQKVELQINNENDEYED